MSAAIIFFVDGEFDGICEDWVSAIKVEAYLSRVSNDVQVVTALGPTIEECWECCNKVTLSK